jgi:rhodanese-related sulfurtransferase
MQNKILLLLSLTLLISCASTPLPGGPANDPRLVQYRDPERLLELVERPEVDIRIIDIRSAEDYAKGHIPGAENIPDTEILERLDELPADQYFIFYCATGARVENIFKELRSLGYARILNWGGIMFWPYERVSLSSERQ